MRTSRTVAALPILASLCLTPSLVRAQAPAATGSAATAAPRQSGTVKAVTPSDLVLTNNAGQDIAVTVPATARILLVDPATRDVKSAKPGTVADIAGGDKAIITGTAGDTGQTMTATRIYLLKSGAIAAMHADEQAAWARSVGGIVRSIDPTTGTITVANGQRTITINTSPSTVVRRYSGASVRFEDAIKSNISAIRPGDQVQARGQRSSDGTSITADEIVTGSFSNFSGLLTAIDTAAGTVTLKDLATKKTVTVAITPQSNLRKLPANFGQGMGMGAGARPAGAGQGAQEGARPGGGESGAGARAGQGGGPGAQGGPGNRAAHMDLARIVNRLPTETVGDLKTGEAVMIVASNGEQNGRPTAITLLSGVDQILAASPNGQTTLSPWSLGGGGEGEAGGEGGAAGGGAPGGPGAR